MRSFLKSWLGICCLLVWGYIALFPEWQRGDASYTRKRFFILCTPYVQRDHPANPYLTLSPREKGFQADIHINSFLTQNLVCALGTGLCAYLRKTKTT